MNSKTTGLRGKSCNKALEADILDREAKEMERNLKNLQERMQQQSIEDESIPKFGGSRWKSARPDKGSVTSYAKSVQDKHRKKSNGEDPALLKTQSAPRLVPQKEKPPVDFRSKDIEQWSVSDVFEWLSFAQLGEYSGSFRANEITGPLLLDIALDDLDYMGVTKLGHRKIILKSIEDLRKNKRITLNLVASHEGDNAISSANAKAAKGLTSNSAPSSVTKKETIHWSHLEPLAANQVSAPTNSSGAINAADDDPLDEAAERAAFQEAVAGWRGSGGTVKIVRESDGERKSEEKADSSMWSNPFQPKDDRKELGQVAPLKSGLKCDASAMTDAEEKGTLNQKKVSSTNYSMTSGSEVKDTPMFQGNLDEAAEHEEFVKAVDAWRNRGSAPAQIAADSGGAKATDKENIPVKVTMGGASAAALAMAAKIATELEVEQQVFRKRMSEQREALEASIKQNEEMSLKLQGDSMLSEEKSSLRERDEQSDKKSHQPNMHVSVQIDDDDDDDDDDCDFSERKQVMRAPTGKQCSPKQSPSGTDMRARVEVSLMASKIGLPDPKTQKADEAAYTVDEGSDDD